MVYEWLTGRYPFAGSFTEVATQHMFTPPPPPRTIDATIPVEVEEVLLIALAKKPEGRFLTVEAFARALEQAALISLSPEETTLLKQPPGSLEMRALLQRTLNLTATVAVPTLHSGEVVTIPPRLEGMQTPVPLVDTPVPFTPPVPAARGQYVSRRVFVGVAASFAVVLGAGAVAFWKIGHGL